MPVDRSSCVGALNRYLHGMAVSWNTGIFIVAKFVFSVNTITHEPLHLQLNKILHEHVRTCTNKLWKPIEYQSHKSMSHGFLVFLCVCMILLEPVGLDSRKLRRHGPRAVFSLGKGLTFLLTYKLPRAVLLFWTFQATVVQGWESPGRKQRWQLKTDQNGVKVWPNAGSGWCGLNQGQRGARGGQTWGQTGKTRNAAYQDGR